MLHASFSMKSVSTKSTMPVMDKNGNIRHPTIKEKMLKGTEKKTKKICPT